MIPIIRTDRTQRKESFPTKCSSQGSIACGEIDRGSYLQAFGQVSYSISSYVYSTRLFDLSVMCLNAPMTSGMKLSHINLDI
jgi:hypothetical protein